MIDPFAEIQVTIDIDLSNLPACAGITVSPNYCGGFFEAAASSVPLPGTGLLFACALAVLLKVKPCKRPTYLPPPS